MGKNIAFLNVAKINHRFKLEIESALDSILASGQYINGAENAAFEQDFSAYCGVEYCVGCANGLDALRLAIKALDLKEGDEIIVPANTYIASILAITHNGCTPVFIEPDIATYNINPRLIESHITSRTKAILVVHLYGQIADMQSIWTLAQRYGLYIIEDAAQAHGAIYQGKRAGALGDIGGFSFYPCKNLGALGDAGAITTKHKALAEKVRILGNYGSHVKYENLYDGFNSRLDALQAAFLRLKLKALDNDNAKRREIAHTYRNGINNPLITLPQCSDETSHVWHLFVIRCAYRERLQIYLRNEGIETLIHYPIPPHKQRAYQKYNHLHLPITEQLHKEVLSLPISPVMSDEEVQKVICAVNAFHI